MSKFVHAICFSACSSAFSRRIPRSTSHQEIISQWLRRMGRSDKSVHNYTATMPLSTEKCQLFITDVSLGCYSWLLHLLAPKEPRYSHISNSSFPSVLAKACGGPPAECVGNMPLPLGAVISSPIACERECFGWALFCDEFPPPFPFN